VAAAVGVAGQLQGKGVAVADYDQDGDLDLFVVGQVGKGVVVGDLDNDGWPDLLLFNRLGVGRLYRNNGNGTFTDITQQFRTAQPGSAPNRGRIPMNDVDLFRVLHGPFRFPVA